MALLHEEILEPQRFDCAFPGQIRDRGIEIMSLSASFRELESEGSEHHGCFWRGSYFIPRSLLPWISPYGFALISCLTGTLGPIE